MSSREQFEAWVMTEICISKSTLEGLRTEDGYRNSTLSGTDYNRMWNCWQAAPKASEQQLAVAISERDAAVKAEMVWEKSMMEACGEDGPASVAAEISALRTQRDTALESLRQQLAAVVAENAGLKVAHPQPFGPQMMKALDAYEKHQDEVPETGMLDAYFILRDSIRVETPATDAAIAKIQAQGVDAAIERLIQKFEGTGHIGVPVMVLESFAAQLRQGAAL